MYIHVPASSIVHLLVVLSLYIHVHVHVGFYRTALYISSGGRVLAEKPGDQYSARVENGFLHTLGIISVILHAIHTQDIST